MQLIPPVEKKIKDLVHQFRSGNLAVLPILSILCREYGIFNDEIIKTAAHFTKLSPDKVKEIIDTYYPENPILEGKYNIVICINYTCAEKQSQKMIDSVTDMLDIKPGETTADKKFSLMTANCLGGCSTPPNIKINDTMHKNMDMYKLKKIVSDLIKNG